MAVMPRGYPGGRGLTLGPPGARPGMRAPSWAARRSRPARGPACALEAGRRGEAGRRERARQRIEPGRGDRDRRPELDQAVEDQRDEVLVRIAGEQERIAPRENVVDAGIAWPRDREDGR